MSKYMCLAHAQSMQAHQKPKSYTHAYGALTRSCKQTNPTFNLQDLRGWSWEDSNICKVRKRSGNIRDIRFPTLQHPR
eukprot:460519-Pelagomonas_calceolata.AAC.4